MADCRLGLPHSEVEQGQHSWRSPKIIKLLTVLRQCAITKPSRITSRQGIEKFGSIRAFLRDSGASSFSGPQYEIRAAV